MQHNFLYLLLVHRAMLSTVQTIQYLMIEVSLNNDLEAELVSLHQLVPDHGTVQLSHLSRCRFSSDYPPVQLHQLPASTTSPDYVLVQLHRTAACRPSPEHATPLYHSVVITVLQAVCATSLSSGTWRLSDHSAMCYTDSVPPLPSSLFML